MYPRSERSTRRSRAAPLLSATICPPPPLRRGPGGGGPAGQTPPPPPTPPPAATITCPAAIVRPSTTTPVHRPASVSTRVTLVFASISTPDVVAAASTVPVRAR